ncbi:hypothetical protein BB559_004740, partial [Furculomyces boomerangus]
MAFSKAFRFTNHKKFYSLKQKLPKPGDKVYVGMSGGVDSSVSAYLLQKQGFDVSAIYMQNWDTKDEQDICTSEQDWFDVQKVCEQLKINCTKINLVKEYWNRVFSVAIEGYQAGFTPNPDILCNQEVKFGALIDKLNSLASTKTADNSVWFATGHYTNVLRSDNHPPMLQRGVDPLKDQSYFLSGVSESKLAKVLFPIGNLIKSTDVRTIANEIGLVTATKKESMGICFIGERKRFHDFISQYIPATPGNIVSTDGKVIGTHNGLFTRTIGQSARITVDTRKWFVCNKNIEKNEIVAVPDHNNPFLYTQKISAKKINWINKKPETKNGLKLLYQIRHLQSPKNC